MTKTPYLPVRYLQAESSYCKHHLVVGRPRLCSHPLKYWLATMYPTLIVIHRSYAVDAAQVEHLRQGDDGWQVELSDGTRLPVSRRRLAGLKLAMGLINRKQLS